MKRENKKKESDYPQLAFRTASKEQKDHIMRLINEAQDHLNRQLEKDQKRFHKNEVIISALEKGLALLIKRNKPTL